MSLADVLIVALVVAAVVVCVRSIVRSNRAGECADCAVGSSCTVHDSGRCEISHDIVTRAAQAADSYAASHPARR